MTQGNSVQIISQPNEKVDPDSEDNGVTKKEPGAFRTISEVADEIHVPQHVLRFWETRFPQVQPIKRSGGRRYYRVEDITLLKYISELLYIQGYTIKGVQRLLQEELLNNKVSDNEQLNFKSESDISITNESQSPNDDLTNTDENNQQDLRKELEKLKNEKSMLIDSLKNVLVELQELKKIIAEA